MLASTLFQLLLPLAAPPRVVLHIAPAGSDANSGSSLADALASCAGAVKALEKMWQVHPQPESAVEVRFSAGTFTYNDSTACGTVALKATQASPLVFRGAGAAATVIDGAEILDASGLRPVSNETVLSVLNPAAKGKLLAMTVQSTAARAALTEGSQLQWNGVPLIASKYPNSGLGYVQRVYDSGHRGATSNFSMSTPIGANISIAAPRPTGNWELEMATGFSGGSITGYLSLADWYRETHQVARVSQSADEITLKLLEWSRYDICEAVENGCTNAPGRFVAHGWLSEVDSPGEWYYDRVNNILYIFPPAETSVLATSKKLSSLRLGAWSAGAWIRLLNASWVTVRDLTIQGAAQKGAPAVVSIEGGNNNAVGGCTIRNSALTAVSVDGGLRHTVIGNDIYDVARHISSVGPIESIRSMIPSNHLFANNHITQLYMRGFYGGVHITNVGDRFSGNLVHDCMGQVITMQGPLTMLDSNEIFNTGYAEGDGGVMYNAGSLTRGYGMSFHNNFIHHSLCVPGLHPRGGIYFDGHQQGCTNLSHNVMYKAAGRAFIVNGGPNYQVNNNLVINGGTGVYQQNADFTKAPPKGWSGSYLSWYLEAKDNSTHTPSPWDFIWNSEQDLGVHVANMSSTMLATRFPSFAQAITVNSTEKGWASVEHSAFQHNMYLNLSGCKVAFLTRGVNGTPPVATGQLGEQHDYGTVVCDQAIDKNGFAHWIDRRDSIDAMWSWFPHSRQLEFKHPLINVDTGRAGLRCDQWRKSMPSPAAYRPWVRAAFAHLNSSGGPTYSREIATEISGLRSGKHLLLGLTKPCPSPSSSSVDCEGVLLPWGQCEANGTQIMRWTVEQFGVGAGKPCEYRDGTELRVSCRAKP